MGTAEGITTLFVFGHIPSHLSMVKCSGSRFQFARMLPCGDHLFTYFVSHKDTAVGTKNLKFGLIRAKDRFQLSICPFLMFLGPSKSLLLIGVL